MQSSGEMRRENAKSYSTVIVRLVRNCALGRTIQYSRDSDGQPRSRSVLGGYPAFAGYDDWGARIARPTFQTAGPSASHRVPPLLPGVPMDWGVARTFATAKAGTRRPVGPAPTEPARR